MIIPHCFIAFFVCVCVSSLQMRSCNWTAVPSVLLTSLLNSGGSSLFFQVTHWLLIVCVSATSTCPFAFYEWKKISMHFYMPLILLLGSFWQKAYWTQDWSPVNHKADLEKDYNSHSYSHHNWAHFTKSNVICCMYCIT